MEWADWGYWPPIVGLFGGTLLGLAARRGRFCTMGAIEDALYAENWNRIRMWAIALATGIAGTFGIADAGLIHLDSTLYASVRWNPVASIVGGLCFGYGMAIAGNCGYGALARLGGGDLRSLVIVVVMGVVAYAVLAGPLAAIRVQLFPIEEPAGSATIGYAHAVSGALGINPLWPALLIAGALALWALSNRNFRQSPDQLAWGIVVGLAVVSGWAGTSFLSEHSFDVVPVESHGFTAPVGETMIYAMTSSAGSASFAVGSVLGVVFGALLGSISRGQFRWEACDDPQELGRQIMGGALMGVGGVLALGCSVGQGLAAFSTLAFSAPIALAAIFVGAALGLRQLIQGFEAT
jgi:uncharacterized membrane protein YedE/YeeE